MKEFALNCPGSIQTLSKEEFIAAADHISTERAIFKAMTQEPDDDVDDDGGVTTNAQELREISIMLGLDEKSKPS